MDYELWLRLGKKYSPGVIHDHLACFRRHLYSKSESGYVKQFSEEYQIAKENTNNPFLLLLHKLNILKIVAIYWLMGRRNEMRKAKSEKRETKREKRKTKAKDEKRKEKREN